MNTSPIVYIGSIVVDIRVEKGQKEAWSLGGCALNAAWIAHLMQVPYLLFSPIGVNQYAEFVRRECKQKQLQRYPLTSKEENGRCHCYIDEQGERSFACTHGAEYHFYNEWFTILDAMDIHTIYICGLEIEEDSGRYIIDYIKRHPELTVYFACGPRITAIKRSRMLELFACSCILHLNEVELCSFCGCSDVLTGAKQLYAYTHNTIIITLGKQGSCYYDGEMHYIASEPAKQIDTTGAGDAHLGTLMSALAQGCHMDTAMKLANKVAALVVSQYGALLDKDTFIRNVP